MLHIFFFLTYVRISQIGNDHYRLINLGGKLCNSQQSLSRGWSSTFTIWKICCCVDVMTSK